MSNTVTRLKDAEDRKFVEIYREFEKNLDDLTLEISKTEKFNIRIEKFSKRGALKSFIGGFTGKNDKEITEMVSELSQSLGVTQKVLQIVMQVQNTKNKYLREFHSSLVNKIINIQNDTITLDDNQKEVAISIVEELKEQVSAQIEQQEMVDKHQKRLQELDGFVSSKDLLDSDQDQRIKELESRALEIIRVDEHQQQLIAELKAANASKDELDKIQTQRIDLLVTEVMTLDLESEHHQKNFNLLEAQYSILVEQIKDITQNIEHTKKPLEVFKRQLPSYAALLLGVIAVVLVMLK